MRAGNWGKKHIKFFSLETIDPEEANELGCSFVAQLLISCSSALPSSKMTLPS
jgi:hypothetical protein